MKTLILVVALSLCACATPKRTKANLAIDAEPSDAPASKADDPNASSTEDVPPEGEIDLGLEGSSGPVHVEGAMSAEDEDAAIASSTTPAKKGDKKGDAKKGDKKKADDEEADDESAESDEETAEE